MAYTPFPLLPGVYKDDTPLKREGQPLDSQWMRWDLDAWETMGGYEVATTATFTGIARGGHAWADTTQTRVAAFGTAANLYAYYGGAILDITPQKSRGTLVNAFTTESGSNKVIVRREAHGLKDLDPVTFSASDAVGGLVISGTYAIEIVTFDTFRITASGSASSTATGGGSVEFSVPLDTGLVDGIGGLGFGSGPYGGGGYGITLRGDIHARVWSLDSFGNNNLMALYTNGALYEWQPQPAYPELIANGTFDSATGWVLGTGWSITGGKLVAAAGTASTANVDLTGTISGGVTYALTFDVTDRTTGSVSFQVTDASSNTPFDVNFGEPVVKNQTYTRRFTAPANPTFIKFAKDATFNGKIDNVSIKIESKAYRLQDAPQYSRDMFVDPGGYVVLLGTVMLDGTFNALGVRWSDRKNNRTWTPNDDNEAGFDSLLLGSEIRGGLATRGQNLIWTDAGLYRMLATGNTARFRFDPIAPNCGLIHKNAMIDHLGTVFWWGSDQNFHIFTGGAAQTLKCSVRDDVMKNLARGQESKITCDVDPAFNEIKWTYPDQRDGPGGIGGIECSRYVIYNWEANSWYVGKIDRSQWISRGVFETPIAFSLDGKIYFHELGNTVNGDTLRASLGPVELDMGDGDYLMRIDRLIADFKSQQGVVNVRVGVRSFPQAPVRWYDPYECTPATLKKDFFHTGRILSLMFDMEGAPLNVRFGRFQVDIKPTSSIR